MNEWVSTLENTKDNAKSMIKLHPRRGWRRFEKTEFLVSKDGGESIHFQADDLRSYPCARGQANGSGGSDGPPIRNLDTRFRMRENVMIEYVRADSIRVVSGEQESYLHLCAA